MTSLRVMMISIKRVRDGDDDSNTNDNNYDDNSSNHNDHMKVDGTAGNGDEW